MPLRWSDFLAYGGYLLLIPAAFGVNEPGFRPASLAVVCMLAFTAWMLNLRRLRAIRDTPTCHIASAALGYAELSGKGRPVPGQEVLSPAHMLPCLWYRYRSFERYSNGWRQTESGQSDIPFILDDGSGSCLLDPVGADILVDHRESYQEGDYRIEEELLLFEAPLYALGELGSHGGALSRFDEREEVGDLLEDWKHDPDELKRRFDLDGDGELSPQEWQLAQAAARREVEAQHQAKLDAPIRHVLGRPANRRPFIIANYSPKRLLRRYRMKIWLNFAICLGALFALPFFLPF